jgi:hypothetical protein
MPGPSDFRKNLSLIAGLPEPEACAWRAVFEYRLPAGTTLSLVASGLVQAFDQLSPGVRDVLEGYLRHFLEYRSGRSEGVVLDDCAVGNLIVAGAYLAHNQDFDACLQTLARLCRVRANLINVSQGEAPVLVALKENGELLSSEAAIVAPQSRSPIFDFFLLPAPLATRQIAELQLLPTTAKCELLRS